MRSLRLLELVYQRKVRRLLEWSRLVLTEDQLHKSRYPLLAPKGCVAQAVERRSVKPVVAGSTPAVPSNNDAWAQIAALQMQRDMMSQQHQLAARMDRQEALNRLARLQQNVEYLHETNQIRLTSGSFVTVYDRHLYDHLFGSIHHR